MIFINCLREDLVQVNDKTRIDVSRSFVSGDAITDILIKPEATEDYISIFDADKDNWYLDWSYATDGTKTISVQATDGSSTVSNDFTLSVISVEDDNLYSDDSQIFAIESELKRYFPSGRNSYLNIHREAQSRIVNYLDRKRIWNSDGTAYTKNQLNLTGELQKWSLYETISIIYNDLFISGGDKFAAKVNEYKELRNIERDRGAIRIDSNSSGTIDTGDHVQDLKTFMMRLR